MPGKGQQPARKAPRRPEPSLMECLGIFCGDVWRGVRAAPPAPVSRKSVEEKTIDTPTGRVTVRRTIIEEVIPGPQDTKRRGARPGAARPRA